MLGCFSPSLCLKITPDFLLRSTSQQQRWYVYETIHVSKPVCGFANVFLANTQTDVSGRTCCVRLKTPPETHSQERDGNSECLRIFSRGWVPLLESNISLLKANFPSEIPWVGVSPVLCERLLSPG